MFEWDEKKRKTNLKKHGVDFYAVANFNWDDCIRIIDNRKNYGEERWVATGEIGDDIYICVYVMRGNDIRIISLRKANQKEVYFYETQAFNE